MNNDQMATQAMWGLEEGDLFDLFKAEYDLGKKKVEYKKGETCIRGFVPKKYMPSQGGVFKMYHHKAGNKQVFGLIEIKDCTNVKVEEHSIYFESESLQSKYILVPSRMD
jgi:hypothetical protein